MHGGAEVDAVERAHVAIGEVQDGLQVLQGGQRRVVGPRLLDALHALLVGFGHSRRGAALFRAGLAAAPAAPAAPAAAAPATTALIPSPVVVASLSRGAARGGDDDDAARARTMDEMGGSRTRVASARPSRRAETASAGPERRPRHHAFAAVPAPEVGYARVEPRGQDDGDAPPFPSAPTAGWAGRADARVAPRRPGDGRGCRPRRRRAPRDPDAFHHRTNVDGCSAGAAGRAAVRGMPSPSTGTFHDDDSILAHTRSSRPLRRDQVHQVRPPLARR